MRDQTDGRGVTGVFPDRQTVRAGWQMRTRDDFESLSTAVSPKQERREMVRRVAVDSQSSGQLGCRKDGWFREDAGDLAGETLHDGEDLVSRSDGDD